MGKYWQPGALSSQCYSSQLTIQARGPLNVEFRAERGGNPESFQKVSWVILAKTL